jgi:hypothetical protein
VRDCNALQSAQALACQPRRARVVDRQRQCLQRDPGRSVDQRSTDEQQHPDHNRDGEPGDCLPGRVALVRRVCLQRQVQQSDDRVAAREQCPLAGEGPRDRQAGDEDEDRCRQQRAPQHGRIGRRRVCRPDERRLRPPHEREHDHRAAGALPAEVGSEQRCHLRYREHEHEVPQQSNRADPAVGLGSVRARLTHNPPHGGAIIARNPRSLQDRRKNGEKALAGRPRFGGRPPDPARERADRARGPCRAARTRRRWAARRSPSRAR